MVDPYKMVFINLILSSLVFIGIIIFKVVYPRKKINLLYLLIVLSLLPLVSILRKGSYESGDLSLHSKIAMSFYTSLSDGNIVPQWSATLCSYYGCPFFEFIYPLPYYIVSFFHFVGLSFINSIKLLIAASFISSGIAMYLWTKEEFGKLAGFTAAILYLFAPYHLVDIHFRVAIGEILAFVFLPLVFLSCQKLVKTKNLIWYFILAFSFGLLILSHQVISLSSFPFIVLYILFLSKKKNWNFKELIYYFSSLIYGIILSSFYTLPVIFESKYTQFFSSASVELIKFSDLIYSPWRYGFLFQGPKGELSSIIGYIQLLIILTVIISIVLKKFNFKKSKILIFFLASFLVIFILMQPISKPFWDYTPLVKSFQFSFRLLLLTSFFTSAIAAILVKKYNSKAFIFIICFIAIFSTILNWGNRKNIPQINDSYLNNELYSQSPFKNSPLNPKWVNLKYSWISKKPKLQTEVLEGKAITTQIFRNSTSYKYKIEAKTNIVIKENTFYYPLWNLKINNKKHELEYSNPKYPGIITYKLPKGTYNVEINFEDTFLRSFSKKLSLVFFTILIISLIKLSLFNKTKNLSDK